MVDLADQSEIGHLFLEKLLDTAHNRNIRSFGSAGIAKGGEGKWLQLSFQRDEDGKSVQFYACVCEGERGPILKGGLFEGDAADVRDQIEKFRERHQAV